MRLNDRREECLYSIGDYVEIAEPGFLTGRGLIEAIEDVNGEIIYVINHYGHLSRIKARWVVRLIASSRR